MSDASKESIAVARAGRHTGSVAQDDHEVAAEPTLHLANRREIDDSGPAHTYELPVRKSAFDGGYCFADPVLRGPDVNHDVVAVRFDPVDVTRLDEPHAICAA